MDAATLARAFGCSLDRARGAVDGMNLAMLQAECTTVRRAAMWAAQVGHETLSLRYDQEIWGPTKQQLKYDPASGTKLSRDLGNTAPGDGYRYRGRGRIQLTGKGGYGRFSVWCHDRGLVPTADHFVRNPDLVAQAPWRELAAAWYWTVARKLNPPADQGSVRECTRLINGGYNGLEDRQARYTAALKLGDALLPTAPATTGGVVAASQTGAPSAALVPARRPRQQEDTDMLIVTPEPAAGAPKNQWPTVRRSMGFDPAGGWGGKVLIKAHFGPRGGWIHLLRWWVRDPNWNPNQPKHFARDHPGAAEKDPGVERWVGYAWESAPPAGADELEFEIAAPDGLHIFPVYER